MRDYFTAELRHLRQQTEDFTAHYPQQARALAHHAPPAADPYLDRLLAGVATLTGRIQQRIDEELPDLYQALLWQFCPQWVQGYPSACIVAFGYQSNQRATTLTIPRHALLQSDAVGPKQRHCYFRTTRAVQCQPVQLVAADCSSTVTGMRLCLRIQVVDGAELNALALTQLPIFLAGDRSLTLPLYFALTHANPRAQLLLANDATFPLCIKPSHLTDAAAMLPIAVQSFSGLQCLLDYFVFEQKYLFIDIEGFAKVTWPSGCQQFDIIIESDTVLPKHIELCLENFKLNCVPAINLYKKDSEPILLDQQRHEYPLHVDQQCVDEQFIYSVDQVVSMNHRTGARSHYYPLSDYSHREQGGRYFSVSARTNNKHMAWSISVGGLSTSDHETLSCTLTVSDGYNPGRYLNKQSLHVLQEDLPHSLAATLLTHPSAYVPCIQRNDYRQQLIAHLAMQYSNWQGLATFKQLLYDCDWAGSSENKCRIEGVRAIKFNKIRKLTRGYSLQGVVVTVTVDEASYSSLGDIYLFTSLIRLYINRAVTFNQVVDFNVICHPSQQVLTWPITLDITA